ncbi:hypothetical protein FNV43_RR15511 [Rhamnella rubrinervis]|uniref:Transcription repressor n=1 Tax=Rhamnella rubrinervis TaxID=2594499 RepID=A0A8K0GX78_9ROSA|nr:hypothetical protein FNV43_RR15511 [Rhamnella rubrinervis]
MGKKMKLPFLSKSTTTERARSTWPWPSCSQPRTLSFRTGHDIIRTINSAYLDTTTTTTLIDYVAEPPESFFTNSSDCASFSTASEESPGDPIVEAVTRGLRSGRLFFEPGETSSIMEETKAMEEIPFKESVVLPMESQNPYLDFKRSMEEMVEAHGLKDWEDLEELLCWYLKVNGKSNHGYVVGAFVDLLVGLAFTNSSSSSSCSNCNNNSFSSPLSLYNTSSTTTTSSSSSSSTPCISSTEAEEEIEST